MKNELMVLEFDGDDVRIVKDVKTGEPWFVATDICRVLGYKGNTANRVRDHCKEKGVRIQSTLTNGGDQLLIYIDEANLYRLIMKSNMQSAERFQTWIAEDVIPSIRKTGSYSVQKQLPHDYIEAVEQLLIELKKNKELEVQKVIDAPKVHYYDMILQSVDLLTTRDIAKDYGCTPQQFNKLLKDYGVQYYSESMDRWYLTAKYDGYGYTHAPTVPFKHRDGRQGSSAWMKWTQKGRLFLYNFLKQFNILPTIERS